MRIGLKKGAAGRLPLLYLFLAGILAGMIVMNAGKSMLLEDTGLLDEYTLYHMKYMTVDSNALFWYVMGLRLKNVVFMAALATTYLGIVVVGGAALYYGVMTGIFLSALVMRYGIKGILLAAAGIFPQYLLYVPAFILLMLWCERLCRKIYFQKGLAEENPRGIVVRILQLAGIILVVITGCVLEGYVNPMILGNLLKIF